MSGLLKYFLLSTFLCSVVFAELPGSPSDVGHPGSKIYSYNFKSELIRCSNRDVFVFIPQANIMSETFPVVIYGHGQALKVEHYQSTMEHLAKKGIIAIFPNYDTGFFDRDWRRMAQDYVGLSDCALKKLSKENKVNPNFENIIYSGHSKGAYVAGVAAGLSFREKLSLLPHGVMLFEPAGLDEEANASVDKEVLYNVVYSDNDKVVSKKISQDIYNQVPSLKKQFLLVKSYPELEAGHFWPLTKPSAFGGTGENALHYYSSWKWLVALALGRDQYLFGNEAIEKGISGISDEIIRNW
ncbi:MAG: hypothetical protein H7336_09565 [Bacteriovorax sp.]|nr:hypothetical protein [Bacteriovorax sp.]